MIGFLLRVLAMRAHGVILIVATAFAPAVEASTQWPSIVTLADSTVDPSVSTTPPVGNGPTPSIIELPDTPAGDMPSVLVLGAPAPANETADPEEAPPLTVIRGGEIGGPLPPPPPEPVEFVEPLLDPNDRGTPAKRNALKRQQERLEREAEAARQAAQPGS